MRPIERLRSRVVRAGTWTVLGALTSHALRFGSNLVLTRLLFPEAFGLMAILTAILVGVTMISDVGLSMSIVRSQRGTEPLYLNTVWTMQIVRGVLVALGLCIAARPVAAAYGQPLLGEMLPALGLVAILNGLNSTKSDLASREVKLARPITIGIVAQLSGIVVMVGMAVWRPSPWSLLAGNIAAAVIAAAGSHLYLPGPSNRLAWDRRSVHEVMHFGGWIMLGSTVAFFAGEGAQLVRAALVDMRLLGLLGLASALSLAAWSIIQQVAGRVLFPAYSEVWRDDPARQSSVVEQSRRVQVICAGLFSTALVFAGPSIIMLLYDARYADAGLILQVQSAGFLVSVLTTSYSGVLAAIGRPRLSTAVLSAQVLISLACLVAGARVAGALGVVISSALAAWLFYPVNALIFRRLGYWHPRIDIPMLIYAALVSVWVALHADWSIAAAW